MTDLRTCKHCHFVLTPKESAKDQAAIMHGLCSDVCRRLWEDEKEYHLNKAIQAREAGL